MTGMERGKNVAENDRMPKLKIIRQQQVNSTNTVVKQWAEAGAPEGTVLLADSQSAGRGRLGRTFYSPDGTGLYMSILLRPNLSVQQALFITTAAAAAAAEAIEQVSGEKVGIKWVNDIFIREKKVCGILTESAMDAASGNLRYAVLGIGVNLTPPENGFPEELQEIATALMPWGTDVGLLREQLVKEILERFFAYYPALTDMPFFESYRSRCFVLGRRVRLIGHGSVREAAVIDLDHSFGLRVRLDDGSEQTVMTGEISLRL